MNVSNRFIVVLVGTLESLGPGEQAMLEHMDTVEILLQHYGWLGLPVESTTEEKEEQQPVREPSEESTGKIGS